mgnify:CR=1 FL=1
MAKSAILRTCEGCDLDRYPLVKGFLKRVPEYENFKVEYAGGKPRIDFYDKKNLQLNSVDISDFKDEDNIDDKLIEFGIDYNKTYFRKDMEMQEEEFDTQQADEYHPPPQEGNSESNDESQGPQNESTGEYTPYNNKEYQNPDDEEDEEGFGQFNNQMFFGGGGGGGFEYGGDDDDGGGGG